MAKLAKASRKLTKKDVLAFLRAHPLGTLITIGARGVPEPSAIYFCTEKDFTVYLVTKSLTKKFKNVSRRPKVTLYVYDEGSYTTVTAQGKCAQVTDSLEFAQAIEKFQDIAGQGKSNAWIPPVAQIAAGQYVACAIHPTSIRMRRYAPSLENTTALDEFTFDPRV